MLPRGAGRKVRPFFFEPGSPKSVSPPPAKVYHPINYIAGTKPPITPRGTVIAITVFPGNIQRE